MNKNNLKRLKKQLDETIDLTSEITKYAIYKFMEIKDITGLTFQRKNNNTFFVYDQPRYTLKKDVPIFKGSASQCMDFLVTEWKNGRIAQKPEKIAKPVLKKVKNKRKK